MENPYNYNMENNIQANIQNTIIIKNNTIDKKDEKLYKEKYLKYRNMYAKLKDKKLIK